MRCKLFVIAVIGGLATAVVPVSAASKDDQSEKSLSNIQALTLKHVNFSPPDPTEQKSALYGLQDDLPSLTESARKKLVARGNAGDLPAMYELARRSLRKSDGPMGAPIYFWGDWGDVRETEKWWRKAAAAGDPKAMILLGHMYASPWGVPQNISEAATWFEKAAAANQLEAIQDLIDLYLGAWSDERDEAAATFWLERAAALGDRHAALILGLRYDAGWDAREDPAAAASWYEKVLSGNRKFPDHDDRIAMNNLGALYEQGRGLAKNERKAAALYHQAAGYPSLAAMYNLAALCETGHGVPQDKTAALWLYRLAATFGQPEAKSALERLGYNGHSQDEEVEALLAHDNEKRVRTICDP